MTTTSKKMRKKKLLFCDVTVAMNDPLYTDYRVCGACGRDRTEHVSNPLPKCLFGPDEYTPRGGEENQRVLLRKLVRKVDRRGRQLSGLRTRLRRAGFDLDAPALRVRLAYREVMLTRRDVAEAYEQIARLRNEARRVKMRVRAPGASVGALEPPLA